MNRFFHLFCCWIVAGLCLLSTRSGQAQVTVGSAPNAATVKIDWPTVSYAAIDVSGDVQGDSDVNQVLLGEDGTVVFNYQVPYDGEQDADHDDDHDAVDETEDSDFSLSAVGGVEFHVCTWKDGALTGNQSTPLRTYANYHCPSTQDSHTSYDHSYYYYGFDYVDYFDLPAFTLGGQWISSKLVHMESIATDDDGTVFEEYEKNFGWLLTWGNGNAQRSSVPVPPYMSADADIYTSWFTNGIEYTVLAASDNGTTLVETDGRALDAGNQSPNELYGSTLFYLNHGGTLTFFVPEQGGCSADANGHQLVPLVPFQVNDNGWAVARGTSAYTVGGSYHPAKMGYVWNGSACVPLHNAHLQDGDTDDSAQDLNNSNQVVVKSTVGDDLNSGGYLWETGTNGATKTYLRAKLPKYLQAQVTDLQPLMISEKATDGTICIFGTVTEGNDWSYVVCTRDGSGVWSFAKTMLPEDVSCKAINSRGMLAVTHNVETDEAVIYAIVSDEDNYTTTVELLVPVTFTVEAWNPAITPAEITYNRNPDGSVYSIAIDGENAKSIMQASATVRIDLPDIVQADLLAQQWQVVFAQDITITNPGGETRYLGGNKNTSNIIPLPSLDANVTSITSLSDAASLPRILPFSKNHDHVTISISDSPTRRRNHPLIRITPDVGVVAADERNVEFTDFLFVQRLPKQSAGSSANALTFDSHPTFLKWFSWRSRYNVNFTFFPSPPFAIDADKKIWDFKLLGQGNGRGSITPVFTKGVIVYH